MSKFIEITGHTELSKKFERLAHVTKTRSGRTMKDVVDFYIAIARDNAPVDQGNLKNSIKILGKSNNWLGVTVGVDEHHTPATRAEEVGQYALIQHRRIAFLDMAEEQLRRRILSDMENTVKETVREFNMGTIGGMARSAVSTVFNRIGAYFGAFFGR